MLFHDFLESHYFWQSSKLVSWLSSHPAAALIWALVCVFFIMNLSPTFTVYCSSCLQLSSCLSFSSWHFLSLSGHSANVSVFWVFLNSGSSYASHLWGNEARYVPSHFQRPFLPQSPHPFTSFSCLTFCVRTLGVCFLLSHQFILCTFHCLPILLKTSFLLILIQFSWIFSLYISSM